VSTAIRLLADLGFDGLDIDWEYPSSSTEAENYVLLLQELRAALDAYSARHASGYHFLLTIASPAGPTHYGNMKLGAMARVLDFFNLMAYDYSGSWDSLAGHQANLFPSSSSNPGVTPFSTQKAVGDYLAAGVGSSQIVLGMPIYGRSFANTDGVGKPFSGVGGGTWEAGVYDYKALPRPGATVQVDAAVGASYSYDAAKKEFVSYDTPEIITRKVGWVKEKGLAGSMFWEASADRTDEGSLIGTSARGLGGLDRSENMLRFPDSKYDNLRGGMP